MEHFYNGNKLEEIKMQYFNGKELFIVTQTKDLLWHLYNHTKDKELISSSDWQKIYKKIGDE